MLELRVNSNLPSKYTQLSSPDYNSLITNGRYVIIASSTGVGTNAPNITVPIAMDVTGNNGTYCVQVAKSMMSGSMAIRELVNGTWGDWKYIALKSDLIKHSRISFDWTPPGENSSIDCTVVLPVDYSKIVCISVNTNTTNAYAAVRAATGLLCYIKVIQIAGISVTSVTGYVDVLYTE